MKISVKKNNQLQEKEHKNNNNIKMNFTFYLIYTVFQSRQLFKYL